MNIFEPCLSIVDNHRASSSLSDLSLAEPTILPPKRSVQLHGKHLHRPTYFLYSKQRHSLMPQQSKSEGRLRLDTTASRTLEQGKARQLLHKRFKFQERSFFQVGMALEVLQADTGSESFFKKQDAEGRIEGIFADTCVHHKVRRVVVVATYEYHCQAVPITTHSGRGAAKVASQLWNYGIIYTGESAPSPLDAELCHTGESLMQPRPIRMVPHDVKNKKMRLYPESRIDYSRSRDVEYNVRVALLGRVDPNNMADLQGQWRNVLGSTSESRHEGPAVAPSFSRSSMAPPTGLEYHAPSAALTTDPRDLIIQDTSNVPFSHRVGKRTTGDRRHRSSHKTQRMSGKFPHDTPQSPSRESGVLHK